MEKLPRRRGTYTTDEPNHVLALQLAGGYRIAEED